MLKALESIWGWVYLLLMLARSMFLWFRLCMKLNSRTGTGVVFLYLLSIQDSQLESVFICKGPE